MGPQLLTMKECSDNKVPLVKMSHDDPLCPSRPGDQVDSDNNNLEESNMITKKVFNAFKPLKIVKRLGLGFGTGILSQY